MLNLLRTDRPAEVNVDLRGILRLLLLVKRRWNLAREENTRSGSLFINDLEDSTDNAISDNGHKLNFFCQEKTDMRLQYVHTSQALPTMRMNAYTIKTYLTVSFLW